MRAYSTIIGSHVNSLTLAHLIPAGTIDVIEFGDTLVVFDTVYPTKEAKVRFRDY
jgi:hypothetical protein